MKLGWPIVVALTFGPMGLQDIKEQGLALFEQAELTLKRESDPVRRAHGAIIVASLIREVEPDRGETLLRLAAQALSQLDRADPFERGRRQMGKMPRVVFRTPYDVAHLWEKLLEEAAKLRADLVREFLAEVAWDELQKGSVLSRLARSVHDPRTMSELVEMSLSHAVSFSAVALLFELRERDPERSRAIFHTALERAVRRGDLDGLYWLGAYAIPGVNLPNRFPLSNPPAPDPALARMYIRVLVEVLSQAALQVTPTPTHIYRALVNIRPYAEQFVPEIVPQVDSLLTLIASRLSPKAIAEVQRSDLERTTPKPEKAEDLERRAQGARDEKTHDDLMAQAAFLTLGDHDFERALSLAAKIKDRAIRSEMQDLIHFTAAIELAGRDQSDRAERHALAIEHPERLAVAVANVLPKLSDKIRADALLTQAQARIERLQTGGAKGRALLYLVGPAMSLDVEHGRFLLNRAIILLNATKTDLNGAGSAIRVETGEFATGRVIGSSDLATVVIEAFAKLTEADPELVHAPSLAMMWESAEIRAIAQAAIARSLTERAKRRTDTGPPQRL